MCFRPESKLCFIWTCVEWKYTQKRIVVRNQIIQCDPRGVSFGASHPQRKRIFFKKWKRKGGTGSFVVLSKKFTLSFVPLLATPIAFIFITNIRRVQPRCVRRIYWIEIKKFSSITIFRWVVYFFLITEWTFLPRKNWRISRFLYLRESVLILEKNHTFSLQIASTLITEKWQISHFLFAVKKKWDICPNSLFSQWKCVIFPRFWTDFHSKFHQKRAIRNEFSPNFTRWQFPFHPNFNSPLKNDTCA